jgi:hypothetical protein
LILCRKLFNRLLGVSMKRFMHNLQTFFTLAVLGCLAVTDVTAEEVKVSVNYGQELKGVLAISV